MASQRNAKANTRLTRLDIEFIKQNKHVQGANAALWRSVDTQGAKGGSGWKTTP
jgi:hypothetical protein